MNILSVLGNVKKQERDLRVYAILIEGGFGQSGVIVVAAYALEEALSMAKAKLTEKYPIAFKTKENMRMTAWDMVKLDELLAPHIDLNLEVQPPVFNKNEIMKQIVASKDPAMLEQYRAVLSEAEARFCEKEIKK